MDREMEGTDTTNPNELSTEQLRANAFASASSNMNQLALNSQKEALEYLTSNSTKLDEFIAQLDTHSGEVPLGRTLVVALGVVLLGSHVSPTYEEARASFISGYDLLQKLAYHNYQIGARSTYDILRTFFPDGCSDYPQVYPNFFPEEVEQKLGGVGINLYNWLDGTYSLLQNRFDL